MSEPLEGDEWKHAREPKKETAPGDGWMTRAQAQAATDLAYMRGEISLEEWRDTTDFLSEPTTDPRRPRK